MAAMERERIKGRGARRGGERVVGGGGRLVVGGRGEVFGGRLVGGERLEIGRAWVEEDAEGGEGGIGWWCVDEV